MRDPRVDPRLPTKGTGEYEWKGFLKPSQHPFQVNPPCGALVNWNNRPAPELGRRRRQLDLRLGAARADAQRRARQARHARPRVGHVGDERGRDAGPAQRRADAGRSTELLQAAPAPSAARDADARAARRVARRGLVAAGPRPRRRDGRGPGARDLGRVLPAAVRRRRCRSRALDALVGTELRHRPATSPTAASGTSTRTCARSIGDKLKRPVQRALLRRRRRAPGAPPRSGRRSTRVAGRPGRACAPTPTQERIAFRPGCCRPRSATRTARAGSSR